MDPGALALRNGVLAGLDDEMGVASTDTPTAAQRGLIRRRIG